MKVHFAEPEIQANTVGVPDLGEEGKKVVEICLYVALMVISLNHLLKTIALK